MRELLSIIKALDNENRLRIVLSLRAGEVAESQIARFNPVDWSYQPAPAKDGYARELDPIVSAAHADAFTLIDLRPLRPIVGMRPVSEGLRRTVLGFDALLVMSGSTPSGNFERAAAD